MVQANDSVLVTPGSGATIATHVMNGKEYQVVILAGHDGHIKGTKDSYVANFKLATDTAVSALSHTFTANQEKQFATIYHTAAAVKTAKIRRVELYIAATAATILNVELRYLTAATAPATGNPTVAYRSTDPASPTGEASCLALPTTAGSVGTWPFFTQEINLGANTALTTTFPPDPVVLWPAEGDGVDDVQDLIMRAGVAEGYAVSLRSSVAVAIKATARIIFTEA